MIDGAFVVSENGKTLMWIQDAPKHSNIITKDLPTRASKRIVTTEQKPVLGGKPGQIINMPVLAPLMVDYLAISPDGEKVVYRYTRHGLAWGPYMVVGRTYYTTRDDSCQAIDILDVNIPNEVVFGPNIDAAFGNVAFYTPTKPPFDLKPPVSSGFSVTRLSKNQYERPPLFYRDISVALPDIIERCTQKRNVCFPVFPKLGSWKPGEKFFAAIYQTASGYGPIVVFDCEEKKGSPGFYEIPVSLKNCEGLAFRKNGSLTFLSGGTLFEISGESIKDAMQRSAVVINDDDVGRANLMIIKTAAPLGKVFTYGQRKVAVGNSLPINPAPIAQEVDGLGLCWVSDGSFITQRQDKGVYLWRLGGNKPEKKADLPEMGFSYYAVSPFKESEPAYVPLPSKTANIIAEKPDDKKKKRLAANPAKAELLKPSDDRKVSLLARAGTSKIKPEKPYSIGEFSFFWKPDLADENSILLVANAGESFPACARLGQNSLENVAEPGQLNCTSAEANGNGPAVLCKLGETIVFKANDAFLGIQPLRIEMGWLTFKCRFWPSLKTASAAGHAGGR